MVTINPYVNFDGNAQEAFDFYKSVFGGEFASTVKYKDSPEAGRVKPEDANKLMHISLPIGKTNILMATDALGYMGNSYKAGNNFALSVSANSEEEANRVFSSLASGGKIGVPISKQFWGSYFGMLHDQFGIQWMISHDPSLK